MNRIHLLTADKQASLPTPLSGLDRLANNYYWTWHPDAQAIFSEIDPVGWRLGKGAVEILTDARNLEELSKDSAFVSNVKEVISGFDAYLKDSSTHYTDPSDTLKAGPIAYFCAEYGFHESYNQYAGGLGILAADHCKEASDKNLPFVGIGLFYRRGFFHQMVDWEGRQECLYPVVDPDKCPVKRVLDPKSKQPLFVSVEMPGRLVKAAVWVAEIGRTPILLLDTDVDGNTPGDKAITAQLYTNWRSMRLHQELVLGVGGVRALRALGIAPSVWHLNEGHSAFLILERLREYVAAGKSFKDAQAEVKAHSILTIHTPVPEGNERFDAKIVEDIVAPLLSSTSIKVADVLKIGLDSKANVEIFDMTAFALRLASGSNGVSLLHGRTADKTWHPVVKQHVIGVTNGAHMPSWVGPDIKALFKSLGLDLKNGTLAPTEPTGVDGRPRWSPILGVDDKALWEAHQKQKRALLEFARERLLGLYLRHGYDPAFLNEMVQALDPNAFLIGFSRRFATYKRASLVFSDIRRATKLFHNPDRPVQIIFSGKSHPNDRGGQKLISKVFQATVSPKFKGKIFFLEDYDIEIGRMLVQGTDVWLNNPRRPLEASGTSGMKAAANGVPNASILDGWWDEGFDGRKATRNGFAIGDRSEPKDLSEQDKRDGAALYKCLEEEVIPLYFQRDADGLTHAWIQVMKNAIASSVYDFSTARMIEDYLREMYLKAAR